MVFISRKQYCRKFIQSLQTGYFVKVEFDLGANRFFHPYLLDQNMAFKGVCVFLGDVKIFFGRIFEIVQNKDLPKTVRFRNFPAQQGTFMDK